MNSILKAGSARGLLGSFAAILGCALACHSAREPRVESAPAVVVAGDGAPTPFLTSDRCAPCHSHAPTANALTTRAGDDASPHGTWQATAMANSFRDPYWRAQMAREIELAPEDRAAIETLCLTCHASALSHSARLHGAPPPTLDGARADALAADGVSCTVCHRATPEGLGTPSSFGGNLRIHGDARIFGPFPEPAPGPMRMQTGYTPTHGEHVRRAALCGACHTLSTRPAPDAPPFLEQAPYLEWRNSVFSDEQGATSDSRTCQQCHMPDEGSMRIARNPGGGEFNIAVRDGVRAHAFVGGNALLADILRENAAELGVVASPESLERIARATRAQLAHETARIEIQDARRAAGRLTFDVRVENLAGHKLPSGYPARRAWLDVEVRAGDTTVFASGSTDADGRLVGVADELALPHVDRIERADQVAVYEMLATDLEGRVTTSLTRMARRAKDTRLLPRGWKPDGPHADETRPIGTAGDGDFEAGLDRVTYDVALDPLATDVVVVARLRYQAIPPAWAAALTPSKTAEAAAFLRMYAAAKKRTETLATAALAVP